MHGMELGTEGMHNQIRQWLRMGFLTELLDVLLDNGFNIYLCSDHGNIEATGYGRPSEGSVADLRAQRVRIYPNQILRKQIKEAFPETIEWPPVGLPENYYPLLAPGRLAFRQKNSKVVTHGGLSLEEVIVPYIKIERR